MQTLRVEHLTKTYGEKTLFDDLNFIVNEHDRIGVIGTNGSGKTTLMNALSGVDPADSGQLVKPNDYRIGYLMQTPQLDPDKTVLAAVFDGAAPVFQTIREYEAAVAAYGEHPDDPQAERRYVRAEERMNQEDAWNADNEAKAILTQLHIKNFNQRVGTLSGGQQKRIGMAQVLLQAPDLLILDEPTNHLDFDSIAWLEEYLQGYKGALIIVTHDRYFLDQVATQIFELSFGKLYQYTGNYEDFVRQKAARVDRELTQEHKQQQLYKKELAWMRTGAKARSTKQQARINHFHELEDNLGHVQVDGQVNINLGQQRLGKKVLELKDAALTLGDHRIMQDFNLLIQGGARIGITGMNGAGKTSFLNALVGTQPLDAGKVIRGETVRLAYYKQHMEKLPPDKRVISYLNEVGQSVVNKNGDRISTTQLLEQFLFPRFMHGTLIRKLSGGEQRRLYLLKLLMSQPNVLVLDEPTNDLDVGTLTVLEDYLEQFKGTVITVSHDRYFLDKVVDQLLIFDGDARIERYTGRFTEYLAAKQNATQEKEEAQAKPKAVVKPNDPAPQDTPKKKLTYAEQLEFDKLEDEIDALEEQKQAVTQEMAASAGDDYPHLAELQQQLDDLNAQIDAKMARWDELSAYVD